MKKRFCIAAALTLLAAILFYLCPKGRKSWKT